MNYAFIPARSGSARLKDKNIRDLAGKPLFVWTLEAALQSRTIDKVIFSTDSDDYANIAMQAAASFDKPLLIDIRTEEYAGTKSKIFDYLKGELLRKFDFDPEDLLVQLLPTCPLRNSRHIDEAVSLSRVSGQGVFAACEYDFHVSFAFREGENNSWVPLLPGSPLENGNTQSQDQASHLHPNGSINCLPITLLRRCEASIYIGCCCYKMAREFSIDIDDLADFEMAAAQIQYRYANDR